MTKPFTEPFTVAIDGPAAAGKGTISKAIATHFSFAHLDTGLLYRAVGLKVMNGGAAVEIAQSLEAKDLSVTGLRTAEVAQAASKVAIIPEVRAALLDFQRAFARRAGGAVLDGRDIGTVICPQAEVKLFVTASAEVRGQRRYQELIERGETAELAQVIEDVKARDARDAERAEAPMKAAQDAQVIDTSDLSIQAAIAAAVSAVSARRA